MKMRSLFQGLGVGCAIAATLRCFGLVQIPDALWGAEFVVVALWLHAEVTMPWMDRRAP